MIQCVGLNPAFQKTITIERFTPGAVNRVKGMVVESSAGKGINVARVLHILGHPAMVTGFCGGETGRLIQAALSREGIAYEFAPTVHSTRTCTTILDPVNRTQTELVEEGLPVSAAEVEQMYRLYNKHVAQCQLVTISGTMPLQTPDTIYADFVRLAHTRGIRTLVDAQKNVLRECLKAKPFLVKINQDELQAALEQPVDTEQCLFTALQQVLQSGVEWVVLTQGKDPTLVMHASTLWEIRPPVIQPVNPIGAGDAVLGGIAAGIMSGKDVLAAIGFGTACGTASALTLTPGAIRQQDIAALERKVTVNVMRTV